MARWSTFIWGAQISRWGWGNVLPELIQENDRKVARGRTMTVQDKVEWVA